MMKFGIEDLRVLS